MIKVNARKAKWEEFLRKLSGIWDKVKPKKVCKVVDSVYFRLFWGKIGFTDFVYLDTYGPVLEYSAVARGRTIGYWAHGNWNPYGVYSGEVLYKWAYKGSWGYVDER